MILLSVSKLVSSVPNWYDYNRLWYKALGETSINFRVQACEGAYIALSGYSGLTNVYTYEIGLGIEGNSKSEIRYSKDNELVAEANGPVLGE